MDYSRKWIDGVTPSAALTDVARRSLHARLGAVWFYAPRAADKSQRDVEAVHQLRVSVRRARAACKLYDSLLPPRRARRINKRLRKLRKVAGDARDLDVLAIRLRENVAESKQRRVILKEVARYRRHAQRPLAKEYRRAKRGDFAAKSAALIEKTRWREEAAEPCFGSYARVAFLPMVDDFFVASDADLSDVKSLHQMRISGKQIRYAMELLESAFDRSFREQIYPVLGDVQDHLGRINDHATALARYQRWLKRRHHKNHRRILKDLIDFESHHLEQSRQTFLAWWTRERIDDLAAQFDEALRSEPAGEETNRIEPVPPK